MNPKPLAAELLLNDHRVLKAKELLLAAVADAQKTLAVREGDPNRAHSYHDLLNAMAEARGAPLWHTYLGSGIGRGTLVELLDGSVKYDLISGIGTHYLGHSNPLLISAAFDAAACDIVMQGHLQQNSDSYTLMRLLLDNANMDHCFLSSSGAMANENALKIAFHKREKATRVLAFNRCFMGRTMVLSQITDRPQFREGLPTTIAVDYLPFYDAEDPAGSTIAAQRSLHTYLKRYPGQYGALCCEFVLGEGGFYPGTSSFFAPLMAIARQEGIAVIADEIQTFGRLPQLFAFHHLDLAPYVDIVTVGKLSYVAATLFRNSWKPRPGLLSQTYTASSAAIRGAIALLRELLSGGYFGPTGKICILHDAFTTALKDLEYKHPGLLRGPYGIGAMIAFTPYHGTSDDTVKFVKALFDAGVIAFVAGTMPTRVRFLLPVGALTIDDIPPIMAIVERVLLEQQPPQRAS